MITAPKDIYSVAFFEVMLHELTMPRVLSVLGVTERTVYYWLSKERVPKAAMHALFWESRYGRSVIDSDHDFEINLMRQQIQFLSEQLVKAKHIITGLRQMQYGSANEPLYDDLSGMSGLATNADTEKHAQAF